MLHQRSISQHNSSANLEHITAGFRHRRSLTGSDWRSPIGHDTRFVSCCSSLSLALIPSASPLNLRPPCFDAPSTSTSRYFITSLSFSLWISLSLSLFIWKVKMKVKWNEWESLSLSSFFKILTLSDSLFLLNCLWLADSLLSFNFINILPLFLTFSFWLYPLVLVRLGEIQLIVLLWFVIVNFFDWQLALVIREWEPWGLSHCLLSGVGGGWAHGTWGRVRYLN